MQSTQNTDLVSHDLLGQKMPKYGRRVLSEDTHVSIWCLCFSCDGLIVVCRLLGFSWRSWQEISSWPHSRNPHEWYVLRVNIFYHTQDVSRLLEEYKESSVLRRVEILLRETSPNDFELPIKHSTEGQDGASGVMWLIPSGKWNAFEVLPNVTRVRIQAQNLPDITHRTNQTYTMYKPEYICLFRNCTR